MNIRNKAGMVLTEALVAVATLATATVILGSIITSAADSTKVSKNYLQAQNLLSEGVEAVKNMRDSNWLIKPDKPECWLYTNPAELIKTPNPNCNNSNSANKDVNYLISNTNNQWNLVSSNASDLNLQNSQSGGNEKYRLHKVADTNELVQQISINNPSPYYRSVKFLNIESDKAKFEVKIEWQDGAKTRTLSRQFTIYNYL